jgi:thymidylate kinase
MPLFPPNTWRGLDALPPSFIIHHSSFTIHHSPFNKPDNLMTSPTLPPLIAIVGCDGSGKSTLTELLQPWLAEFQPTVICHLGKQSGNMGRTLVRLPLLGAPLEKSIRNKVRLVRKEKGADLPTALGIYAFVVRRGFRFRRMMRLRRAGNTILTDRYPQIDVPGSLDGPGLGNARTTGPEGWLRRREQRKFEEMVAHLPDLVIRLNVSLEVAHARKPDHRRESLARKIGDLARLTYQGATIVELDAEEPLETVQAKAKAVIAELLLSKYGIRVQTPPRPQ